MNKTANKLEGAQQHVPAGAEVRVVSASVIAQLQAQGLQVRLYYIYIAKYIHTDSHIPTEYTIIISMHSQTHNKLVPQLKKTN